MKKKLISGLFLMLWMALLIAAMVYPQGIFPVLAASGVWVACLLTWAVIPVLTGGAAYRQWLSESDAVSAGAGSTAH